MSEDALKLVAERFKVLSEPIRLQILQFLKQGDKSVNELSELVNSSQPNVSKHLKIMQRAGILDREKRGNIVFYRITDSSIFTLCELVCGSLQTQLKNKAAIFPLV